MLPRRGGTGGSPGGEQLQVPNGQPWTERDWPPEVMAKLLESLTEAVALLDGGGRVLAGNGALTRLSGCDYEEWDAAPLARLFAAPADERIQEALARARDEGAAEGEARGLRPDGSEWWLRLRLVRLADPVLGAGSTHFVGTRAVGVEDWLRAPNAQRPGTHELGGPNADDVCFLAVVEDITGDVERRLAQSLTRQLLEEACRREAMLTHVNRELAALNQLAATVNQSLNLETVLDAALERALEVAEAGTGWVFLLSPGNRDELELVAHRGLPADYVEQHGRSRVTDCLPGKTVITGKPLVLYSLPADEEMTPHLRAQDVRCVAHIPLRNRERTIGALGIGSTGMHQLTEGLVRFLTAVGHQVGLAIENARLYEQVKHRADRDPLTGLYNRQRFCELLDARTGMGVRSSGTRGAGGFGVGTDDPSLATSRQHSGSPPNTQHPTPNTTAGPWVLMLDIDEFKQINDTYGHDRGDRVLQEVAELLRRTVRETDITARYGGDEFVVALCGDEASPPEARARRAELVVERLRTKFAEADRQGRFSAPLAVSIGRACSGTSSDVLLQLADAAMYREKRRRKRRTARRSEQSPMPAAPSRPPVKAADVAAPVEAASAPSASAAD